MTPREALVSLNLATGVGSVRLRKLLEYFGTPQEAVSASVRALMSVDGIGEQIANQIVSVKKADVDDEFRQAEGLGVSIITCLDPEYPLNLKQIADPPIVLYVKGALREKDVAGIAIVGSRQASVYGRINAQCFARQLAACGVTIISGLARGVDTCAIWGRWSDTEGRWLLSEADSSISIRKRTQAWLNG